jgi:hypothetical protein
MGFSEDLQKFVNEWKETPEPKEDKKTPEPEKKNPVKDGVEQIPTPPKPQEEKKPESTDSILNKIKKFF